MEVFCRARIDGVAVARVAKKRSFTVERRESDGTVRKATQGYASVLLHWATRGKVMKKEISC